MVDFFDLPRPVRDRIYRLHLVKADGPLTLDEHLDKIESSALSKKYMPSIMEVSKKAEKEAAPIYYGENHFDIGSIDAFWRFSTSTWVRHLNLVRAITCAWTGDSKTYWTISAYGNYGATRSSFLRMSKMKRLESLNIRVDEAEMVRSMHINRESRQRPFEGNDVSAQEGLAIFRFPGMAGLLAITKVRNVQFIKMVNDKGEEYGGLLPDGPLVTHILPRLRPQVKTRRKRKGNFRFLDLPPELRNRVYDLISHIPGPIHPSTKTATTAPKDNTNIKVGETKDHESALSLLAVNKQINDEAVGVFYNCNSFVFYYPTQLHAFLLSLSPQRQKLIRDLTIYYYNLKCGGIDLVDLTFPMLKQLTGLRKLHIIMTSKLAETSLRNGWLKWISWRGDHANIADANPALIVGMKHILQLRGITDIKIRDTELERTIAEFKDGTLANKPESEKKISQLARAYEHFNAALKDMQSGKINQKLLDDPEWHTRDVFPTMDEDHVGESDEESDEEGKASEDENMAD